MVKDSQDVWVQEGDGPPPLTWLVSGNVNTTAYEFVESAHSWRESNWYGVFLVSQGGREIGGWVYANPPDADRPRHWVGLYDEACIAQKVMTARNPQGVYEIRAYGCPTAQDRLMSDV